MVLADIGAAIRSALGFWKMATPRTAGALALYVIVAAAGAAGPALGWPPLWMMGISLVEIAVSILAYSALYRLALAPSHPDDPGFRPGPLGLQWGITEWRVAGAMLLTLFFAVLVALAVAFVALLSAIAVYAAGGAKPVTAVGLIHSAGGLTLLIVSLIGALVLLWAMLRLALALPATVDRKLVQVFSSWGLTRGRVLDILVTALVLNLPVIVLGVAGGLFSQSGETQTALVLRFLAVLVTGLTVPLVVGAYAWFYRRATGDSAAVAAPRTTGG